MTSTENINTSFPAIRCIIDVNIKYHQASYDTMCNNYLPSPDEWEHGKVRQQSWLYYSNKVDYMIATNSIFLLYFSFFPPL